MQKSGIAGNLGGFLRFRSYQITYQDLTTVGLTQTLTLESFGQGSVVLYTRIKHSVAFAGTAWTGTTVSVGKTGGSNTFFASAFNIFQAVADGTLQETFAAGMGQLSSVTMNATFTAVGGNLNVGTAGIVNIDVLIYPVTTPTYVSLYTSGAVL